MALTVGLLPRVRPLLAGNKGKGAATAPLPEKAQLVIMTPGPFYYDLQKDFAQFDIPAKRKGQFPEQVLVTRFNPPPLNTDGLPALAASTAGLLGAPLGQGRRCKAS